MKQSTQKNKITLTKEQAINDLIERVNDWDLDNLIAYVTEDYTSRLDKMTSAELEDEYCAEFSILDTDEEELEILDTKVSKILYTKG